MNRSTILPLFLTVLCLISGCSLFTGPDSGDEWPPQKPGTVSVLRQEEIRKTGSFRCFLPPDTPDAVRILLLRTGSRMDLTPAFRTADPGTFPAMLRAGYADTAYAYGTIPEVEVEAERLQLRSIVLPVGGVLLIRPDDPEWEERLREAIPQE